MRRRGYRIFIRIAVMTVILMVVTALPSWADETYSLKDNDISMTLPDGWTITEKEGREQGYETVLTIDTGRITADLYYGLMEADRYIYFSDDEEGAAEWYERYGRPAAEDFAGTVLGETPGEGRAVDSEWAIYYGMEAGDRDIFITGSSADDTRLVNRIFVFDGAVDMETEEEIILDTFYDFGYYETFAGVDTEEAGTVSDEAGDGEGVVDIYFIIGLLAILGIPIAVIAAVVLIIRKAKRSPDRKGKAALDLSGFKRKEGGDRTFRKKEGPGEDRKRPEIPEGDSYVRSLETLRKSGLVTRKEMDELLGKYERTKAELERRRRYGR